MSNGAARGAGPGDGERRGCSSSSQLLESSAPEPSATTASGECLFISRGPEHTTKPFFFAPEDIDVSPLFPRATSAVRLTGPDREAERAGDRGTGEKRCSGVVLGFFLKHEGLLFCFVFRGK